MWTPRRFSFFANLTTDINFNILVVNACLPVERRKEIEMKRRIGIFLTAVLVLALSLMTGCGSADEKAVKDTSDQFMAAMEEGKLSEAEKYCIGTAMDETDFSELSNISDVIVHSMGIRESDLSKTTQKTLYQFSKKMRTNFIKDYSVGDVTVKDDTATAEIRVAYGYDTAKVAKIDLSDKIDKIMKSYLKKNKSKLKELYISEDEEAVQSKVKSDILPDVIDAYSKQIEKIGTKKGSLVLSLKKQNSGSWKITKIASADNEE